MEVKNLIKKYCDNGIIDNKMSEMGFLFLHTIFIQKGRLVYIGVLPNSLDRPNTHN